MRLPWHFRRITAALACLAILLAALAPSISHALSYADNHAAKSRSLWTEICSSAGLKLVKLDAVKHSGAHGEPANAFEHCPFCQSHGAMPGLPASVSLSLQGLGGASALPSLFYQAPHPLFIWAAAQSRAPPPL